MKFRSTLFEVALIFLGQKYRHSSDTRPFSPGNIDLYSLRDAYVRVYICICVCISFHIFDESASSIENTKRVSVSERRGLLSET